MLMYHCNLKIRLVGLEDAVVDFLQTIEPLERFTHQFTIHTVFSSRLQDTADVVIFDEHAGRPASEVRRIFGSETKCILCTAEPSHLAPASLAAVDDLWVRPFQKSLLRWYFSRMQQEIRREKEAWLSRSCLDATINTLPDLIWYKDVRGAHLKINDAFCEAVGKPREDIQGRGHYYIWGLTKEQYEQGEFVCLESEKMVLEARKTCLFDEHVLTEKAGMRQLKTYKTPLFDADGTVMGTVGIARDVTQEHAYREEILRMARMDALTGLANRRYFYEYMDGHRCQQQVTLCYMDLDSFKELNDTYGHQSGDAALMGVAEVLRNTFPDGFAARIGGDEFMVAFLCDYDWSSLKVRLDYLLERMKSFFEMDVSFLHLSMSIGVVISKEPGIPFDLLMQQADLALYYVKNHGKGHYCLYDEIIDQ